jgi:hypothetical protein
LGGGDGTEVQKVSEVQADAEVPEVQEDVGGLQALIETYQKEDAAGDAASSLDRQDATTLQKLTNKEVEGAADAIATDKKVSPQQTVLDGVKELINKPTSDADVESDSDIIVGLSKDRAAQATIDRNKLREMRERQQREYEKEVTTLTDRLEKQMKRRRSESIIARMIAFGGAGTFAEGATNSGIAGLAYNKEADAFENAANKEIRAAKAKIRDREIADIKENFAAGDAIRAMYIKAAEIRYTHGQAAAEVQMKLAELNLKVIELNHIAARNESLDEYQKGMVGNALKTLQNLNVNTQDKNIIDAIGVQATAAVKLIVGYAEIIEELRVMKKDPPKELLERETLARKELTRVMTSLEDIVAAIGLKD